MSIKQIPSKKIKYHKTQVQIQVTFWRREIQVTVFPLIQPPVVVFFNLPLGGGYIRAGGYIGAGGFIFQLIEKIEFLP